MRNQTSSHSGPHVPHLLRFVLLSHLAIVIVDCIELPLHAVPKTGTYGEISKANIMISSRCRLGNEVGCSIPVYVPHGSRKELIFSLRSVKGQHNSLSPDSTSQCKNLSDSHQVRSSAPLTALSYINPGPILKSDSTALPRISSTYISTLRPQNSRPAARQIFDGLFDGILHSTLSKDASGLPNQAGVGASELTSEKGSQQSLSAVQSLSMNNVGSLSAGNGRLHSASRKLGQELEYPRNGLGKKLRQLSRHGGHDVEHKKSHQLLEDSTDLIPADADAQTINISKHGQLWKAPPMENGPLITITVAQGEDADFSYIQEAVDSVPVHNTQRIVIRIHAGTYRERVLVPYNKPFITFHGDEHGGTIVSWNATASSSDDDSDETKYETKFGRIGLNVSAALFGTMRSASVTILSDGFVAQHMVFQNSAPPPEPGAVGAQAVAFLIGGDRAAFYGCSFLGAQDTLYDYSGRHYYMNCYIQGSIDFIFGNGRSLFEGCHLHSIATSFGAIAAHQRLSPEDDTGFSFDRCSVTGSGTIYLGRAWSPYARIVFARTYLENIISAEGWSDFGDPQRRRTTFFGQYRCTGPGANLSHRAPWAKLLTDMDVVPYLGLNFVNGRQWLGTTWPNGTDTWPNTTNT